MRLPPFLAYAAVGFFGIVVVLPVAAMTVLPWLGGSPDPAPRAFSLWEYRQLNLGFSSLGLAGGTTLLSLVLGVPLALVIEKLDVPARKLLLVGSLVPLLIPPYMHAIVWIRVQQHLQPFLGFDVHGLPGAVWVLTLAYFPLVTLLTVGGLRSIDRSVEEASLLVRNPLSTVLRVVLPLARPHITAGAVCVFVFALMEFGVPDFLRVRVYPVEIFIQYSALFDERAAAVMSWPLLVAAVLLVWLQHRAMAGRPYFSTGDGSLAPKSYPMGRGGVGALAACVLLLGLAAALPVGMMIRGTGSLGETLELVHHSQDAITTSLLLSSAAAGAATLLAFLLACRVCRPGGRSGRLLQMAIFIPFLVPAITLGIGLIKVWNRAWLDAWYDSPAIVVMGWVARFLPFAFVTVHAGLMQLNPRLEEAAALAGAGWGRTVGRVLGPLLLPNFLLAFFLVFVFSLGELGTSLLVIPPGRETLPIRIYNFMHYGAEQKVMGLCLVSVLLILGCTGLALAAVKGWGRKGWR